MEGRGWDIRVAESSLSRARYLDDFLLFGLQTAMQECKACSECRMACEREFRAYNEYSVVIPPIFTRDVVRKGDFAEIELWKLDLVGCKYLRNM